MNHERGPDSKKVTIKEEALLDSQKEMNDTVEALPPTNSTNNPFLSNNSNPFGLHASNPFSAVHPFPIRPSFRSGRRASMHGDILPSKMDLMRFHNFPNDIANNHMDSVAQPSSSLINQNLNMNEYNLSGNNMGSQIMPNNFGSNNFPPSAPMDGYNSPHHNPYQNNSSNQPAWRTSRRKSTGEIHFRTEHQYTHMDPINENINQNDSLQSNHLQNTNFSNINIQNTNIQNNTTFNQNPIHNHANHNHHNNQTLNQHNLPASISQGYQNYSSDSNVPNFGHSKDVSSNTQHNSSKGNTQQENQYTISVMGDKKSTPNSFDSFGPDNSF